MGKGVKSIRVMREYISPNGTLIEGNVYCRRCRKEKAPKEFYGAVDHTLDTNGLFSVCKDCCNIVYDGEYLKLRTIKNAMISTCRLLNVSYNESALDGTKSHIKKTQERKGVDFKQKVFSLYKSKLSSTAQRETSSMAGTPLTFSEPPSTIALIDIDKEDQLPQDEFWGKGYSQDDIEFLEKEYWNFKKNYIIDDYADKVLLKEICYLLLSISKDRLLPNKSVSASVKELQKLLQTANLSPDVVSSSSSGKNMETYGMKAKFMEEHSPSEIANPKYDDVDNYKYYYKNFLERPVINYHEGTPNYKIDEDGKEEDWSV